jgi:hypothetical protein
LTAFNERRLLEVDGDLPPIDVEQAHYRQTTGFAECGWSTNPVRCGVNGPPMISFC